MNKKEVIKSINELSKKKCVSIKFHDDNCGRDSVTNARRECSQVYVMLLKKDIDTDLWSTALAMAYKYLDEIQAELLHDSKHPDLFKSIEASYYLNKFLS